LGLKRFETAGLLVKSKNVLETVWRSTKSDYLSAFDRKKVITQFICVNKIILTLIAKKCM